jgi:methionyl-tRNA formyltransferase
VIEVSGPTSAARLWVGTGAGVLEILELKPAGKRALAAAEFLRGARLESGARLRLPAEAGP